MTIEEALAFLKALSEEETALLVSIVRNGSTRIPNGYDLPTKFYRLWELDLMWTEKTMTMPNPPTKGLRWQFALKRFESF